MLLQSGINFVIQFEKDKPEIAQHLVYAWYEWQGRFKVYLTSSHKTRWKMFIELTRAISVNTKLVWKNENIAKLFKNY